MATYKTPDVYVEEVSTLPPSVAEVSTAIPAFIGYTEKGTAEGTPQAVRISTFLEYTDRFGGPEKTGFEVTVNQDGSVTTKIPEGNELTYLMYYGIDLYFKNGGGACYIVSVGDYETPIAKSNLENGLAALEKEDDPTIILFTEAVNLASGDYYDLCNQILAQCNKLGDRFGVFDVLDSATGVDDFRNAIRTETEYLKYGAAYTPYLQTSLAQQYNENEVIVKNVKAACTIASGELDVSYTGDVSNVAPKVTITVQEAKSTAKTNKTKKKPTTYSADDIQFTVADDLLTIALPDATFNADNIIGAWSTWKTNNNTGRFDLGGGGTTAIATTIDVTLLERDFEHQTTPTNGITITYTGAITTNIPQLSISLSDAIVDAAAIAFIITPGTEKSAATLTIKLPLAGATLNEINTAWSGVDDADKYGFEVVTSGSDVYDTPIANVPLEITTPTVTLSELKLINTSMYNTILTDLGKQKTVLPPATTMAGVYATTDRNRGVWKAPANVSIVSITGPTRDITSQEQENLNVDTTAGKSINAIRSFTGKGTLVWGARTLAGNDNEWRYVSVRRLFNTIEESCKKSTNFAVFEPNDANTWLKVKAMIDSYLYGLWQEGALAGAVPEDAYFVNVGLGKTMTSQDILEGCMIIEIGIAAVRPAEFIILRFSHKLQES